MTLSLALAQRLGPLMGLNEQTAKAAKPSKMAAILNQRSGTPSESERAAMEPRLKAMKAACPGATLLVYGPRVDGDPSRPADAETLAKLINDAGLCKAVAAAEPAALRRLTHGPNEQKMLWDFARDCRSFVKNNKPDADYVLLADYAFTPDNWEQGMVHLVVCDRGGDWVIVDFQNSHWPDYQSIKPMSEDDCDKLIVMRLRSYLK